MTNRPPSTFSSNSYGFGILQAWTISLLLVCTEANSDRFCYNRADGSFDYFYFVQQWPGAFCSRGCCFATNLPLPAARFGIHGLWPMHFEGTGPCFCSATKYMKVSSEFERSLQMHWAAMQCPNHPNMLYVHGWKKHGICTGMQQNDYFQTAIQQHVRYNILQTFKDAGIYPDDRFYNVAFMQEILGNVFGAKPIITCSLNRQHKASQIYEVYVCLDKENLLPFQCPDNPNLPTNCRKVDALFPAFDPRTASSAHRLIRAPSVYPVKLCTDPNFRNELALKLSGGEEEHESRKYENPDSCDAELGDEFQYFLGNRTSDELDVDLDILEQC